MIITWTDLDGTVKLMRPVAEKKPSETNFEYLFKYANNIKYSNGNPVPIEDLHLITNNDILANRDDRSGWKLQNGKIVSDNEQKNTVITQKAIDLSYELMTFNRAEGLRLESILDEIYDALDTIAKGKVLKGKQQFIEGIRGRLEQKLKTIIR